jgi:hypothetical protein
MFLTELMPVLQESLGQPIAFWGGLCAGLLRLDLAQEPVRTWLDQQLGATTPGYSNRSTAQDNSQRGPQSIEIE